MNKQPGETPEPDPYHVDEDHQEQEVQRLRKWQDQEIEDMLYNGEIELDTEYHKQRAELDESRQEDDGPVHIAKILDRLRKKYKLGSKDE